jgi:SAM-dependent methyltransferase
MSNPVKDREQQSWTQVAPGWARHDERLRDSLNPVSEKMLAAVRLEPGQRVLDIASGTGEPALLAAARVGPGGHVLGTDYVEGMLAFARTKAERAGLGNVEFRLADGEELDVPAGSFDAVLIRWGLMFMPEPDQCLARARAALVPGGHIAVACWAAPDRNPWAAVPMGVMRRHVEMPAPPPGSPGLFAFADPARLRASLTAAGFADVALEEVPAPIGGEFSDGASFVTFILDLAGPLARLFASLPREKQDVVAGEMAAEIEKLGAPGHLRVPAVTWIASARVA